MWGLFLPRDSFLKHYNSFDFGLIEDLETQLSLAGTWIMEAELDDLKGPIQPKLFYDPMIYTSPKSLTPTQTRHLTPLTVSVLQEQNLQSILQASHLNLAPSCKIHSRFWTSLCLLHQFRNIWILSPCSHLLPKKPTRLFWKRKIACWHLTAGQDFSLLFICSKSVI